MELDEFKGHWNNIQDKEFQQQKISPDKLKQIIMNTTDTISDLHAKSTYRKNMNKLTLRMAIGMNVVFLLATVIRGIYLNGLSSILPSIAFIIIIVFFSIVTDWFYKKQEQIFTIYNSDNVKITIEQTITAFKRFYLKYNLIYMFLYPVFYYAAIKLYMASYWNPSQQTLLITCAIATALSFIAGHWYYRIKFFKKLESLEANLKDLES